MSETLSVIIAGAGPGGCTLALLLARARVPIVLLERMSELPEDLHASTWNSPLQLTPSQGRSIDASYAVGLM